MSLYFYSLFYLLIACYFGVVLTVPPDYCFAQFNGSDCRREPTPVFSYHKPGSRCEIQMWRGCPTENMFKNEYLCSLNCLFRLIISPQPTTPTPDDCDAILDPNQCANETITVYTHVYGRCIEAQWGGCETRNMFESKMDCDLACNTQPEISLEKELENLNQESLEELNEILQNVIEEETTTEPPTTEAQTDPPEPESEPASESESHTDSPEVETTTEAVETTTNDDYDEIITP